MDMECWLDVSRRVECRQVGQHREIELSLSVLDHQLLAEAVLATIMLQQTLKHWSTCSLGSLKVSRQMAQVSWSSSFLRV